LAILLTKLGTLFFASSKTEEKVCLASEKV
jgi:hypothetical protein